MAVLLTAVSAKLSAQKLGDYLLKCRCIFNRTESLLPKIRRTREESARTDDSNSFNRISIIVAVLQGARKGHRQNTQQGLLFEMIRLIRDCRPFKMMRLDRWAGVQRREKILLNV